ncbi:hypothetical protein RSOLAG22IIIB_07116 [Rhizoctonia solani]|uniref:F-box domain-containing protein n=1 Tax=Rhizoctonia solani TaxID=456999 RepID=A0A0K6GIT9_9AGAM|nr:hypothetical protein RSOLAG22IIIB_07116 [Rhizoctonia solani]
MDVQTQAFDNVPQEILVTILHNCDYTTIIRFSLTCKKAYETVSSSISLQLHIELDISGLEIADGSSKGNPDYSQILKELRDYQEAWLNLKLGPMISQSVGSMKAEMPNWELRSGVHYGEFRASELDHGRDYLVDRTQLAVLGSPTLPPSTNYGKKFSFCIIDPKQDLAILIEDEKIDSNLARFHLHSVNTGQPHPCAERPIITVNFDDDFLREHDLDGLISTDPEIMGNYLAVKFSWYESDSSTTEILVWNWRAGVLLARIHSKHRSARYTFLDKNNLLVYSVLGEDDIRSARPALLIYRIPDLRYGYSVPADTIFCPSSYPSLNSFLIFELPELHHHWGFTDQGFILSSDLLPGDVVYTKSSTILCSHITTLGLGFQIHNNSRRQSHAYGPRNGTPTEFHIFVNTRHLFAHLLRCQSEGATAHVIPWSQWCMATRWFIDGDSMEHSMDRIYGSQYIRSTTTKSGAQMVSIVDFNTPVIKRHAYRSIATSRAKRKVANKAETIAVLEGKGMTAGRLFQTRIASKKLPIPTVGQTLNQEILTETIGSDMKTVIRVGFKEPVLSCLAYRVVTKVQLMPRHGHWRIHGEYLVGMPRRDWWEMGKPPLSLYKLKLPISGTIA